MLIAKLLPSIMDPGDRTETLTIEKKMEGLSLAVHCIVYHLPTGYHHARVFIARAIVSCGHGGDPECHVITLSIVGGRHPILLSEHRHDRGWGV